jgi:hypothetical protein
MTGTGSGAQAAPGLINAATSGGIVWRRKALRVVSNATWKERK